MIKKVFISLGLIIAGPAVMIIGWMRLPTDHFWISYSIAGLVAFAGVALLTSTVVSDAANKVRQWKNPSLNKQSNVGLFVGLTILIVLTLLLLLSASFALNKDPLFSW